MARTYQPAPYTAGDGRFEFTKDDGIVYDMTREIYDALWQQGCVEVDYIPPENLANEVHCIFRELSMTSLHVEEYAFIEPAPRLASRFITELNYLAFWIRLATARTRDARNSGSFLVDDKSADAAQAAKVVNNAFLDITNNLQFSIMSE